LPSVLLSVAALDARADVRGPLARAPSAHQGAVNLTNDPEDTEKQTDRQLDHAQARSPARTPRPNVTDHQLGEPLHPGEIDRCIPVLAQALASSTVAAERWVSF